MLVVDDLSVGRGEAVSHGAELLVNDLTERHAIENPSNSDRRQSSTQLPRCQSRSLGAIRSQMFGRIQSGRLQHWRQPLGQRHHASWISRPAVRSMAARVSFQLPKGSDFSRHSVRIEQLGAKNAISACSRRCGSLSSARASCRARCSKRRWRRRSGSSRMSARRRRRLVDFYSRRPSQRSASR